MLIPMKGLSYPGHAAIALLIFIIMWASETVHLAVTLIIILFNPLLVLKVLMLLWSGLQTPSYFS